MNKIDNRTDDELVDLILSSNIEFEGKSIPYANFLQIVYDMRKEFDIKHNDLYVESNKLLREVFEQDKITQYSIEKLFAIIKSMTEKADALWNHPHNHGYVTLIEENNKIAYSLDKPDYFNSKTVFIKTINTIADSIAEIYAKSVNKTTDTKSMNN